MPMIGSGDRNRIDRFVFEHLTHIRDGLTLGFPVRTLVQLLHLGGEYLRVGVDQIGDLDVVDTEEPGHMRCATPPVDSYYRHADAVVGTRDLARCTCARQQQRFARDGRSL